MVASNTIIVPVFTLLTVFQFTLLFHKAHTMSPLTEPEPFLERYGNKFERLPESRPLLVPPLVREPEGQQEMSQSSSSSRNSRLFPYFLVQFPNDPCSNRENTKHGVCVSARDCRAANGITVATCAQGFGACCKYIKKCEAEGGDIQVRENSTDIRSGNGSSTCRFILPKGRGICQVRLDFVNFHFGEALSTGNCGNTKLEITGGTVNFPNLCGNLTGQHLYLNYGNSDKIFLHSAEPTSANDTYSIQVSYIRCDSRHQVPAYCSQYYTKTSGQIRSLNWPHQQLNDQEYTVCIADPMTSFIARRRGIKNIQKSSKQIEWSTCKSSYYNGTRDFFISGKIDDTQTTPDLEHCETTDHVQIFGGNKQCGNLFRDETISSPPYLLRVKFDAIETSNVESTLPQGHELYGLAVSKPESGCEALNTVETKCLEVSSSFCNCTKVSTSRPNSKRENTVNTDENNTGFCLSYKIVE